LRASQTGRKRFQFTAVYLVASSSFDYFKCVEDIELGEVEGNGLSILSFSDGVAFKSMPPAQDHKRISDGGLGPNTGEIGCYAPTKIATPGVIQEIEETILRPTFEGMWKEGEPRCGT
jgi:phosphoribosylamine-glycine ligase